MYPTKALGSDGMSQILFQHYWHITRPKVTVAILRVLNTSHIPHALNHTHIVLVTTKESRKSRRFLTY